MMERSCVWIPYQINSYKTNKVWLDKDFQVSYHYFEGMMNIYLVYLFLACVFFPPLRKLITFACH